MKIEKERWRQREKERKGKEENEKKSHFLRKFLKLNKLHQTNISKPPINI